MICHIEREVERRLRWFTLSIITLMVGCFSVGCMVVNYKSNVSHVKTSTGDARSESTTENLTEADSIAPQLKAQIAEKMQGAENVKMGGVTK